MKESVIVFRIDRKGIEKIKQVYSCVIRNAGWSGDFLILSHKISEKNLKWFRDKGIYIKKCKPLFGVGIWWPMTTSKLYIFSEYIKRWKHVIYLDTDVIVKASLEKLTHVKGYSASSDIDEQPLHHQLKLQNKYDWLVLKNIEKITQKKYNLFRPSFNTGVFAFNTRIVKKNTFQEIISLLRIAKQICRFGEQTIENLYFYDQWEKLPRVYNLVPRIYMKRYKISKRNLSGMIFHFAGHLKPIYKPWHPKNAFYTEWSESLKLADSISLINVLPSVKVWSDSSIWFYDNYLKIRRSIYMSSFRRKNNIQEFYNLQIAEIKSNVKNNFPLAFYFYKLIKKS